MSDDKKESLEAVKTLEQNRTGIVLTGQVKDGKIVLDQACLDEIAKKYPDADTTFVAVNAPFDPAAVATS